MMKRYLVVGFILMLGYFNADAQYVPLNGGDVDSIFFDAIAYSRKSDRNITKCHYAIDISRKRQASESFGYIDSLIAELSDCNKPPFASNLGIENRVMDMTIRAGKGLVHHSGKSANRQLELSSTKNFFDSCIGYLYNSFNPEQTTYYSQRHHHLGGILMTIFASGVQYEFYIDCEDIMLPIQCKNHCCNSILNFNVYKYMSMVLPDCFEFKYSDIQKKILEWYESALKILIICDVKNDPFDSYIDPCRIRIW